MTGEELFRFLIVTYVAKSKIVQLRQKGRQYKRTTVGAPISCDGQISFKRTIAQTAPLVEE